MTDSGSIPDASTKRFVTDAEAAVLRDSGSLSHRQTLNALLDTREELIAVLEALEETIAYSRHRFESPKDLVYARAILTQVRGESPA